MFADVYPIKRLPRRFGAFTYIVPESLSSSPARGMFVMVPWRTGTVRGIVREVHDRAEKDEIKTITGMLPECLDDAELNVYETTAKETFQSVSSILDSAFPTPRKRKLSQKPCSGASSRANCGALIPRETVTRMEMLAKQSVSSFVTTVDLIDTTLLVRFLTKHCKGPILFLVPHQHDLDVAQELLSTWNLSTTLCTSNLTEAQRFDVAESWRAGKIPLLLSTRLGSLLLPPKHLGAIVIGRSGMFEHAQYDRNPRYDARRFAHAWSKIYHASLFLCDTLPRCVDLVSSPRSEEPVKKEDAPLKETEIINIQDRLRFGDEPLLTDPLIKQIEETLAKKKRVLIICNQKGFGAKLECKHCGFIEVCGTCQKPLSVYETYLFCAPCKRATKKPDACRKCKQTKLKAVRPGTGTLAKLLKAHWPEAVIETIEKEGSSPSKKASIIVATSFYYEAFYQPHKDVFGLVALACVDQEIRLEQDLSRASRRLLEYRGMALRSKCSFLLQTWDPKLIHRLLEASKEILKEECLAKRDLGQAPYTTELELTSRGKQGFYELNKAISYAKYASKTALVQITPARWKILTNDGKLLQTLKELDDSLVVNNKTWL